MSNKSKGRKPPAEKKPTADNVVRLKLVPKSPAAPPLASEPLPQKMPPLVRQMRWHIRMASWVLWAAPDWPGVALTKPEMCFLADLILADTISLREERRVEAIIGRIEEALAKPRREWNPPLKGA